MKIDTNYTSLAEIDENIRQFYEEETRERITGYSEPNDGGVSSPILEPYTVIILNQPDKVTYQDVQLRKSERKPWDSVIKTELERAMAWEDFDVNHNQYLSWLEELAAWEANQPTHSVWSEEQQKFVDEVVPAPERPTLDTEKQEAFANQIKEELVAYHSELAIQTRKTATFRDIEYLGHSFQMGQGKDGLFGIDNFNKRIAAITADPSKEQQVIYWITKSNDAVPLSYTDIRAIVTEFYDREQSIFAEYMQWRSGDKLTPFVTL